MTAPLRAKRKKGNMIIWALMGLLVVSLTGFGVTSVGSGGAQAIGSVGDRKVTVNEYVRALQAQMREFSQQIGQNLTMEQVQAFGIVYLPEMAALLPFLLMALVLVARPQGILGKKV